MKRVPILGVLVALLVLGTAAAPAPQPTPVIAGLGQQVGSDGRYYSTIAPFSIQSVWHGGTFSDTNGQRDRLRRGTRYIDIAAFANSRNFNTTSLTQAAQAALQQSGFSPKVSEILTVSRQHIRVFVFSDASGSYAESVFVLVGRAWVFALITDKAHSHADLGDFAHVIRSFRVEHQ